jgi:RNA polymerase sigma-70 factor (ECF subfamily)
VTPPRPPDAEVLAALAAGDRTAFAEFFRTWYPRLCAWYTRTGSAENADELAQEVLVRIWRHAATYDPSRPLEAWIFTIARNVRADAYRRRRFSPRSDDPSFVPAEPDPEGAIDAGRDVVRVREALERLPQEQAAVLREAFLDHKTFADIAAAQEVPLGTIKSRARLALASLRRWLGRPA